MCSHAPTHGGASGSVRAVRPETHTHSPLEDRDRWGPAVAYRAVSAVVWGPFCMLVAPLFVVPGCAVSVCAALPLACLCLGHRDYVTCSDSPRLRPALTGEA